VPTLAAAQVRRTRYLEKRCKAQSIAYDAYHFDGDYYALPNLIPILAQPSRLDLVMEIMDVPLPARLAADLWVDGISMAIDGKKVGLCGGELDIPGAKLFE
jgi:hypothetical protein